ncbi:cysteine ABC transporter substrate-binding protein [Aliarcobacter cibarius]|uniref:Transporter substrate-binding domain-containing protein n=1 Tax=Aliarcobacter cibarius TaxID=255507 RepID=A0ABY2V8U8_9BACT|nr:cysteine ABC transporter substrate-binding protein [Aliarcobacter cibarius]TLS97831.1 transporter substrate-binding domain-containing protein [Aliarcobacter cibarius]TLS98622.1 transporter substrate-binding domain-containing protein [Aliarcobacter cibarius]
MKNILNTLKKIAIASVIIPALSFGAESKNSVDEIKEKGKVRIGVFSDKAPFGYLDSNGKNQGFDIVIAKRLTKELLGDENKVDFVLLEPANRVEYLETNKVDIVLANFTVTPERKQKVDFAHPYMKVAIGVISPEKSPIKSVAELKDKKLIVTKGTTAEVYFTKKHPEIDLLSFDHISESFAALKDGRGVAFSQDNTLLFAWAKQNPGFVVAIDSLGSQDTIAPAVKKGNTVLLNWINQTLEKLGKENFIHKAYDETLKPIYGDSVNVESIIIEGGKI